MKPYRKFRTQNVDLDRVQDRVSDTFSQFISNPLLDGVFVSVEFTGAETKDINHLLARQPLGWFVTDTTGAATIYRSAWNNRTLTLTSDAATIAKIYVF
jgi:hypothetical protein